MSREKLPKRYHDVTMSVAFLASRGRMRRLQRKRVRGTFDTAKFAPRHPRKQRRRDSFCLSRQSCRRWPPNKYFEQRSISKDTPVAACTSMWSSFLLHSPVMRYSFQTTTTNPRCQNQRLLSYSWPSNPCDLPSRPAPPESVWIFHRCRAYGPFSPCPAGYTL